MAGYVKNLFVSLDQLGNALAGGDADNTISARIGYHNYHRDKDGNHIKPKWYWIVFRYIVDATFYPVDNTEHCHEAFHADAGERFDGKSKNWKAWIVGLLVIVACAILFPILYVLYLLQIAKPRKKEQLRPGWIEERLSSMSVRLEALIFELDEHDQMKSSEAMIKTCQKIINNAKHIQSELENRED